MNSNLIIPDFFLSWDSQKGRDRATLGCIKKNSIRPILFLYYDESLVSSNLKSNLLSFHCAHPCKHICLFMNFFCFANWLHCSHLFSARDKSRDPKVNRNLLKADVDQPTKVLNDHYYFQEKYCKGDLCNAYKNILISNKTLIMDPRFPIAFWVYIQENTSFGPFYQSQFSMSKTNGIVLIQYWFTLKIFSLKPSLAFFS